MFLSSFFPLTNFSFATLYFPEGDDLYRQEHVQNYYIRSDVNFETQPKLKEKSSPFHSDYVFNVRKKNKYLSFFH